MEVMRDEGSSISVGRKSLGGEEEQDQATNETC